jgi:hypothetical protein
MREIKHRYWMAPLGIVVILGFVLFQFTMHSMDNLFESWGEVG